MLYIILLHTKVEKNVAWLNAFRYLSTRFFICANATEDVKWRMMGRLLNSCHLPHFVTCNLQVCYVEGDREIGSVVVSISMSVCMHSVTGVVTGQSLFRIEQLGARNR